METWEINGSAVCMNIKYKLCNISHNQEQELMLWYHYIYEKKMADSNGSDWRCSSWPAKKV